MNIAVARQVNIWLFDGSSLILFCSTLLTGSIPVLSIVYIAWGIIRIYCSAQLWSWLSAIHTSLWFSFPNLYGSNKYRGLPSKPALYKSSRTSWNPRLQSNLRCTSTACGFHDQLVAWARFQKHLWMESKLGPQNAWDLVSSLIRKALDYFIVEGFLNIACIVDSANYDFFVNKRMVEHEDDVLFYRAPERHC